MGKSEAQDSERKIVSFRFIHKLIKKMGNLKKTFVKNRIKIKAFDEFSRN